MVMVIQCESCSSRFRLKKTLLQGAFAIRFRCRTCGGIIVVRNPEMPGSDLLPSPPASSPSASPVVPASTDTYDELDGSAIGIVPPEAAAPPEPVSTVPTPAPGTSGESAPSATRLEDLVPYSPGDGISPDRDATAGPDGGKRAAAIAPPGLPKGAGWSFGTLPIVAGLGILLLVGGAYYALTSNPGGSSPGRDSSSSGSADAAAKPVYDVQNLKSFIPAEAIAGNLFVITGTVKNVGKVESGGIRVRATLFWKEKQVLMEQTAIAGNQIEEKSLRHMMRIAIEGYLAHQDGEGTGNRKIPPGKSLPFMVVCFDPPGKVEWFEVLATDAD